MTLRELQAIHKIDYGLLGQWQKAGVDIESSVEVAMRAIKSRTPPTEWIKVKDLLTQEADTDSHEYWKREKTKEEVERLRLMNSKAGGEMFDRSDGERIQEAWGSALNLALAERQATAPQLLAGKDEAWIADWFEEENRKIRENLSDLESALWQQVYERYAKTEESSTDGETGGKRPTQAKKDGKRMVRGKRQSGSGTNAKA